MKISAQSQASIAASLREALGRYRTSEEVAALTDIHLQPRQDGGELVIYDDDDRELSRIAVQEWVDYEEGDFLQAAGRVLRTVLSGLKEKGELDVPGLLKPYSFVLVDERKETAAELLLVDDDDTLLLDGELLKGLDEELDTFLKDLLEK